MHLKMYSILQPQHSVNTNWMTELLYGNPAHQQQEWINDIEAA